MAGLDDRQQRFVLAMLTEPDATKAAIAAGYSPNGAKVRACRLLKRPDIQAALEALRAERVERAGVDADWVLRQLEEEATYRGPNASHGARVAALKLIGQHYGILHDKMKLTVTKSHEEALEELG